MGPMRKRVVVGLSGGVDSSVAAALLKEDGYDVIGVFMMTFDPSVTVKESGKHACYGPDEMDDVGAAAAVCEELGIPFYLIDLRKEFRDHVIDYFREEYLAGRTPNPCVVCNHRLKFGFLLDKVKGAGVDFDLFATGHYARIEKNKGRFLLKKAAEPSKDQTYFLHRLTQEQLSWAIFPVGEYSKPRIRDLAHSIGLGTADRPESQDFISGGDYSLFFHEGEIKEGEIVDETGVVLGRHIGIIYYTVGQRKSLGITSNRPLYVLRIDVRNNRIVVSDKQRLFSHGLIAGDINLIAVGQLDRPLRVKAKIRLQHKETAATLSPYSSNKVKVLFDAPQLSVTPGQSAVFYSGDTVVGGGVIEQAL